MGGLKGKVNESAFDKDIEKRKSKLKKFFFGWIKDNYDKIFIGLLIIAFIIRLLVLFKTMNQPLWFDAAEYMSTAKYWGGISHMSDVWYYRRGFFWPLFCSLFFRFGLGETGVRFATVLFSTGIIVISYFLIKTMLNKKYALFSCIGLTFSWVFLFFTGRPMTSIPGTFFLLLGLLFFWKGYVLKQDNKFLYLFGVFFAISVLVRMQYLMTIPIFLIFIFIKEKFKFLKNKSLWITLLIFLLIMVPHYIMYNQHFGNPLVDIVSDALNINIGVKNPEIVSVNPEKNLSDVPMFFIDLPYNLTIPIFILFMIGIFYFFADLFLGFDKIFKNETVQTKLFIFLWIVIPLAILGYMVAYPQQRYTMAILPFLYMLAAIPLFKVEKIIKQYLKFNKKAITFLILIVFVIAFIPNILWANKLIGIKSTSYLELKEAGEWIKQNSNITDIVVTSSFPEISYYSERPVATFDRGLNNPEDHKSPFTKEEFYKFMEETKPKFLILSIFNRHREYVDKYLGEHTDIWVPVKVYRQQGQPVLIIYKSNIKV